MIIISNKKPQLIFLAILSGIFGLFLFLIFQSDKPDNTISAPVVTIEPEEPSVPVSESLFRITLPENTSYTSFSNKVNELNASIAYYDQRMKESVVVVDGTFSEEEWLIRIKRKFIDSTIESVSNEHLIAYENADKTNSDEHIPFYTQDQNLNLSIPISWSIEMLENGDYLFFNEFSSPIFTLKKIEQQDFSPTVYIDNLVSNLDNTDLSLDGDIESIEQSNFVSIYHWVLSNEQVVSPQALVVSPVSAYLFEGTSAFSYDDMIHLFDTIQIR